MTSELLYTLTQSNEKHQDTQSNWTNLDLPEYRSQAKTQVLGPDCFACSCRLSTCCRKLHRAGVWACEQCSIWGTGIEIVTIKKEH